MNSLLKLIAFTLLVCFTLVTVPTASALPPQPSSGGGATTSGATNSTTSINAPTVQSNVQSGLNEVIAWVFIFLKFLAVIACGWGSYNMWKGEFSSGIWAYVAALALFFAPALVDLASKIGAVATTG